MLDPISFVPATPEVTPKQLGKYKFFFNPDANVDPNYLAAEISQIFYNPGNYLYGNILYPPWCIEIIYPKCPVAKYFNDLHSLLLNKEVAYYNAKTNGVPRKICRNFDENDVTNMPSLKKICLNYLHSNLALTYQENEYRSIVTFHYQPALIKKLPLPATLQDELLWLFYNCRYHCNYAGYKHPLENPTKYFFKKGSPAYEYITIRKSLLYSIGLVRLYTWSELINVLYENEFPPEIAADILYNSETAIGRVHEHMY